MCFSLVMHDVLYDMITHTPRHEYSEYNHVVGTGCLCVVNAFTHVVLLVVSSQKIHVVNYIMSWVHVVGHITHVVERCREQFSPHDMGEGCRGGKPKCNHVVHDILQFPHDMGGVVEGCREDILIFRCNSVIT